MSKRNSVRGYVNLAKQIAVHNELKRAIKNFNQRVRYQQTKAPEAAYLPELQTYKNLKRFVGSTKDARWLIKQLDSFTAKTVKEVDARGYAVRTLKNGERRAGSKDETRVIDNGERTYTKWEVNFFENAAKRAYKEQEEKWNRIKDRPVKIAGVEQDTTRAKMTEPEELEMKPRKFDISNKKGEKQRKEFERTFNALDRELEQKRLGQMIDNYIQGLKDYNFLNAAPEIEWFIRQMPPELVYDTMKLDVDATFAYYKDPAAFDDRLSNIYQSWQSAYEEYVGHEWDGEVTTL